MGLMEKVKQRAPAAMPNAEALLKDQFVEHVLSSSLCCELKQLVHRQPNSTLLDVRTEAMQWECEGLPGGVRGGTVFKVAFRHLSPYAQCLR